MDSETLQAPQCWAAALFSPGKRRRRCPCRPPRVQAEVAGPPGFLSPWARAAMTIVTAIAHPKKCSGKDYQGCGFLGGGRLRNQKPHLSWSPRM